MKHLPALDGLRAVAILTVATSHILTPIVPGGFGVTLFFFISGFIITRMMLAQDFRPANIKAFYVRRFFRLAPALFVFILLAGLGMHWLGRPIPAQDYLATLFYYANYHQFWHVDGVNSPLGITWSLAVEEHFYFVFPLLFVTSGRHLAKILITIVLGVLAWRCALVFGWHVPASRTYESTDTRFDSLAWGCLLSVMIHRRSAMLEWMRSRFAVSLGLLVLLGTLAIRNDEFRETLRYTLQGAALMPLFCRLFWDERPTPIRSVLASRPAVFIGNISYSLYLYHFLALSMAELMLPRSAEMKALAIVGGFAGAIASYYLVETPIRRFGSKLAKSIDGRTSKADEPVGA